jgi:PAS domain S-box-containing protein
MANIIVPLDSTIILSSSHVDFFQLVNKLNAGVFRITPGVDGKFIYCNEAVIGILGYSRDEMQQLTLRQLYLSTEDLHKFEEELSAARFLQGKRTRLKNKRGEQIYVEVTASAAYYSDASDVIQYYDGIIIDVTTEVEMYENISHQISTPVVGIENNAQRLLKEKTPVDKQSILLMSIVGAARITLYLSRNLDYMSKLIDTSVEGFQNSLLRQKIATLLIDVIIDLQQLALQQKGIHIHADNKSLNSLPEILLNKPSIEMLAFCILDNAIKYSFENTTIEVSGFESARYINVCIQNEGIPIKSSFLPPNIPNVFTRKFRTPEARAFSAAGGGLGLFLSQRIMELHGGQIILEPSKTYKTNLRLAFPK